MQKDTVQHHSEIRSYMRHAQKLHWNTQKYTFRDTRMHTDTLKCTLQLTHPDTLTNTHIHTEIRSSVQCYTEAHILRNTCIYVERSTESSHCNTHRHTPIETHMYTQTQSNAHSNIHRYTCSETHIYTDTFIAITPQQTDTHIQRQSGVQCYTYICT